ncbi:MAG: hypothetical protein K0S76_1282 [Herbinix sp.]|nr:hypothetical protein [Herbinix sp.]
MITPFINDKLNIKETEEFIDHIHSCHECREELEVYYALLTAMKQLDEDKNLSDDFSMELTAKLDREQEKIIHIKYTYYRKKGVLILIILVIAFFFGLRYDNNGANENIVVESTYRLRISFHEEQNSIYKQLLELKLEELKQEALNKEELKQE